MCSLLVTQTVCLYCFCYSFISTVDTFLIECDFSPPDLTGLDDVLHAVCESEAVFNSNQSLVEFDYTTLALTCANVNGDDM